MKDETSTPDYLTYVSSMSYIYLTQTAGVLLLYICNAVHFQNFEVVGSQVAPAGGGGGGGGGKKGSKDINSGPIGWTLIAL